MIEGAKSATLIFRNCLGGTYPRVRVVPTRDNPLVTAGGTDKLD
jgi:hypothetical protein